MSKIEKSNGNIDLETMIEKTRFMLESTIYHKAEGCSIDLEELEAILEYLEQLQIIKENEEFER